MGGLGLPAGARGGRWQAVGRWVVWGGCWRPGWGGWEPREGRGGLRLVSQLMIIFGISFPFYPHVEYQLYDLRVSGPT